MLIRRARGVCPGPPFNPIWVVCCGVCGRHVSLVVCIHILVPPPALHRVQVLSPRILKTLASNSHLLLLFPLSLRYEMHCWLWIWDVGEQATLAPAPAPRQCRNDANQSVLAHHPFGPSSSSSSASQPICFRKIQGRGAHPCQVPRPLDWPMSPFQQFRA